MYMTQDDILNQLIQLEAEGKPIDEALDLAVWAYSKPNVKYVNVEEENPVKYAVYRWVDAPEMGWNGRKLSDEPVEEGFTNIRSADAWVQSQGLSKYQYSVVRYR